MKYIKGNLMNARVQALVNTVNTVGVMGKGIALQFKESYPENFRFYATACKRKELKPGKLLVFKEQTLSGEKIIINFPTKTEWYQKSKYEYIEEGLKDLVNVISQYQIQSIAIPPLGCGNGGLKWEKVKSMIEQYLGALKDIEILIYEPNVEVKELLKKEETKKESKLTPARAMLLYSMFYYESLGEQSSLFVANKLAWFLQRLGENLRLKFEASHYGPFSVQVGHVLHYLNGKYLKGLEQNNTKAFETIELNYSTFDEIKKYINHELKPEQFQRLQELNQLIDGFQSALALEILATVDYLRKEKNTTDENEIISYVRNWSSRKRNLFLDKYIQIANNHLDKYANKMNFA
ncbi:MAG: macro domain-containing protein [Bacteroidales bacterium]